MKEIKPESNQARQRRNLRADPVILRPYINSTGGVV